MAGMRNRLDNLRENTDAELIAMLRDIADQLDIIGQEQTRRIAANRRQTIEARNAEENEGGLSPPEPSLG